jgi:hypothetical protein
MTGIQLILIFAIVIVVVGLALLTLGKERGSGTIRIPGIGIEITVNSPLIAIALGAGLFLYATIQSSVWPCIVFCPPEPASKLPTVEVTPPSGSEDQTCARYAASAFADYKRMMEIPQCQDYTTFLLFFRWQSTYQSYLTWCKSVPSSLASYMSEKRDAHLKQCGAR